MHGDTQILQTELGYLVNGALLANAQMWLNRLIYQTESHLAHR